MVEVVRSQNCVVLVVNGRLVRRGGRLVGHFGTDVDTRNPFVEAYRVSHLKWLEFGPVEASWK